MFFDPTSENHKRPAPITVGIGNSVKAVIELSKCFDFSLLGRYTIKIKFDTGTEGVVETTCHLTIVSSAVIFDRKHLAERTEFDHRHSDVGTIADIISKGGPEVPYAEPDRDARHVITVTSSVEKLNLGSSPLRIVYVNNSETDAWVLEKPDTCGKIVVYVSCNQWSDRFARNVTFAKVDRGTVKKFMIGAREQKMQIKPGLSYEFALDLYSMPFAWEPGVYEMWVYDNTEKVGSSKLKFRLEATADTVPLLTRMATLETDSKEPYENHRREIRRNFALNWLAKTFDDLKVNPITDRDNQAVLDAKMEQNRFFIDEFMAKWPTRKDSAEIKTLFQVLNSSIQTKPPSIVPPRAPAPEKPVKPPVAPEGVK
jgi:hypothetical protein